MRIQPLGPNGVQTRIQDLQSRLNQFSQHNEGPAFQVPQTPPSPPNITGNPSSQIAGEILSNTPGMISPLNPFGFGIQTQMQTANNPDSYLPLVHQAAAKVGIDPLLFQALVQTESDFNPKLVSRAGAMGLSQLMPENVKELGISDPFDPVQNLNGGARHFADMLGKFKDLKLALAAYNAGPNAVKKYKGIPPYRETQNYVQRVTSRFETLKQKSI